MLNDLQHIALRAVAAAEKSGVAVRKPSALEKSIAAGFLSALPAMQAFAKAAVQLDKQLDAAYLEAGQPYGPTKEGRQRWLMEVAVVLRMRQEERKAMADTQFDLWVRRAVGRTELARAEGEGTGAL